VEGGLISYGTDIAQSFAPAASSIDRILKGETPADLPLQPPSRYDLVLNLKTAKAMGLNVPAGVLARCGPEASHQVAMDPKDGMDL
jgi:putative tryptophan/tyrosine transport system substrate-binding protein